MAETTDTTKTSRRHRSRAEADQLAAEYEASGLRREDFCKQTGIAYHTLSRYIARYQKHQPGNEQAQRWVKVEVAADSGGGADLSVLLASGRRIEVKRGFDATTLRQLVAVLEQG